MHTLMIMWYEVVAAADKGSVEAGTLKQMEDKPYILDYLPANKVCSPPILTHTHARTHEAYALSQCL